MLSHKICRVDVGDRYSYEAFEDIVCNRSEQ